MVLFHQLYSFKTQCLCNSPSFPTPLTPHQVKFSLFLLPNCFAVRISLFLPFFKANVLNRVVSEPLSSYVFFRLPCRLSPELFVLLFLVSQYLVQHRLEAIWARSTTSTKWLSSSRPVRCCFLLGCDCFYKWKRQHK